MNILNKAVSDGLDQRPPEELGRYLQKAMLQIKAEHIAEDGRGVDYTKLASSELFKEYAQVARQLVNSDPGPLSEPERMAFFINIYNCLTIHGLATAEQLPASVLDLSEFWKCTAYTINGMVFSLDDIEHGVLRGFIQQWLLVQTRTTPGILFWTSNLKYTVKEEIGNRPHPSSDKPPFAEADPRRVLSMKKCDPRIHFTLVCGAKSCPPIQVYSAKNLERGLAMAARNFCAQEVEVVPEARRVRLSKIFLWYGSDFGASERELLQCISQFSDEKLKLSLEQLLATSKNIEIEFKDYNWQLNKL